MKQHRRQKEKKTREGLTRRSEPQLDGRYLAIKVVMMPRDTNPYGTIFGGVVLSYIDQAGAVVHAMRSGTRAGPTSPSFRWR